MRYGILTFDEPKPDISRKILHVDMDAFYANIEIRDNPSLKNKPVIIAKHPRLTGGRGIVSTCNYIARKYGVHSAMAAAQAYKLCPQGIFIPGNHQHYRNVSQQIREIFLKYTNIIEPLSLDEAYLDVTNNLIGENSALKIAYMIQKEIKETVNLTCSIGISYNKFIAKIASDFHKPNGITLVTPKEAPEFLKQLPIEKFYGVGKQSVSHFHELGIYTGEDLYRIDLKTLVEQFGKMGYSLYFKVRGIHDSEVKPHRERKSIGREQTFSQFLTEDTQIKRQLEKLSKNVMQKVKEKGLKASVVTLKIRYDDFETFTRQVQQKEYFNDWETCYNAAYTLWQRNGDLLKAVRLLGVSVSHLLDDKVSAIQLKIEENINEQL